MTSQSDARATREDFYRAIKNMLVEGSENVQNKVISFSHFYKPMYLQSLKASDNTRYRRMVTIMELNPTETKAFKEAFDKERRKFSLCVEAVMKALHNKTEAATKYIEELKGRLQEITDGASNSKSKKSNL
jgi:hypothetical protein